VKPKQVCDVLWRSHRIISIDGIVARQLQERRRLNHGFGECIHGANV
jgi:hypothetical protein